MASLYQRANPTFERLVKLNMDKSEQSRACLGINPTPLSFLRGESALPNIQSHHNGGCSKNDHFYGCCNRQCDYQHSANPGDIETGLSEFYVVANGIAFDPRIVTIFSRDLVLTHQIV